MSRQTVNVNMLGEFSITLGDVTITDSSNRSKMIWMLLSYLIYNRGRNVPQDELIALLWGSGEENENPAGALKTAFWRTRQVLDTLNEDFGKELILRKGGNCRWNPEIQTNLDIETFEELCLSGKNAEDEDVQLDRFREALAVYQGDFLSKFKSEEWVMPINVYYHNLYISVLARTLPLLMERRYLGEVESLCRKALKLDPYNEELYQYLMRSLLEQDLSEKAAEIYEELREQLFTNLGITPSEVSQEIYREISRNVNGYALLPDMIQASLREENPDFGAVVCEYSLFKSFYQAEARAAVRRGDAVHVGVLSITNASGGELPRRSLDRAMENLQVQIRRGLRRSDITSRCSASQFVMLLLQANYENSCMVCERIIRAFGRAYPHSPAYIHYTVLPLEPLM